MKRCPDYYVGRWFSILHRLSMRNLGPDLKKFKIGSGQIMFLLELYYSDGVRQEELSTLLNIDGANTTRALNKLEEEGYAVRKADCRDGRAYRVFLTPKAFRIKADLFALMGSWEEKMLASLSSREQETFVNLLKKIGQSVCEHDRCAFCRLEQE
ncbi:MAG: MarR family transcriptional regulator [Firmicutes bacterium]|nr:MarR family transcriptional regulator [Bacillota bacterium]